MNKQVTLPVRYDVAKIPSVRDAIVSYAEHLALQARYTEADNETTYSSVRGERDDYNPYDLSTSDARRHLQKELSQATKLAPEEVDALLQDVRDSQRKGTLQEKMDNALSAPVSPRESTAAVSAQDKPTNRVEQLSFDLRPPKPPTPPKPKLTSEAIAFLRVLKLPNHRLNPTMNTLADAVQTGNGQKVHTYRQLLSILLRDEKYSPFMASFSTEAVADAVINMMRDGSLAEHVPQQQSAQR